jgi:Fur family ferric uptake transcriptional regulator
MRMRNIRNIKNHMEGHLVTSQRQLILSQIQKSGGHVSAKELYRRASKKNKSISLATVYRTLRLFKELGLIEERRLGKVYCYYEIKELHEHQHLVCTCCGNVIEFDSDLVRRIVKRMQRDYGFNVTKTELYIEGYCNKCQDEPHKIALADEASKRSPEQREKKETDKKIPEKRKTQGRFKRK